MKEGRSGYPKIILMAKSGSFVPEVLFCTSQNFDNDHLHLCNQKKKKNQPIV